MAFLQNLEIKMKKICYVVTVSITIKSFFIPQLKFLAENGYDVTVICSPDEKLKEMLGDKIKYIPVNMPRGLSLFGSIKAIKNLKRIFKEEKFDLVQYSTPNAGLYASIASKKERIKVRNYHFMGLRYLGAKGIFRKVLKWIEKKAIKNSTHVECVSESNLNLCLTEKLLDSKKGVVVSYGSTGGVDINRFDYKKSHDLREEKRNFYGVKEDEFLFGFVGRVTKDKGVEELISAFNVLSEKYDNVKLAVIGDLDRDNRLSTLSLSELSNNEKIIRIDATPEIEKFYPMLDALVLPSYREGFGNVVIEAEAMGVPVLVSDIAGPIDAMEDGVTGLKFKVKDVKALCEAMEKGLEFKNNGFGKNAVEFVLERFDSDKLNQEILKRKNQLLG